MSVPSFSLIPHRSVIAIGGPDRVEFLQGLISNDTTKIAAGRAIWAALLTPQGRFLNDMFVVAGDAATGGADMLLLETERERAPALAKKLGFFKLRSKVTVEDRSATMEVAVVFGPDAAKALPVDGPAALDGAVAFVDPRLPSLGLRVLAPTGTAMALLTARGFAAAPLEDYESLRLGLGVPDGSRDLQPEKALLLESGFDELNGVDWNKGCYMGQELTARTKYRGLVKKRLFPVRVEGALPASGVAIHQNGQDVGELRSGIGDRAIALLRIDAARGAAALTADGVRIVPEIPAWMRLPEAAE
jgi:folate-binding protein YgfZ